MKRLIVPFVSVLAASVLWAVPTATYACSCDRPKPAQALIRADAVFSGKVLSYVDDLQGDDAGRYVTFEVLTSWKGDAKSSRLTVMTPVGGGPSCGLTFRANETYLVYAFQEPDGQLETSICTPTKVMAQAHEDLLQIGEGRAVSTKSFAGRPEAPYVLAGSLLLLAGVVLFVRKRLAK